MITVLAGGVGAAKFLEGLVGVMSSKEITVIANTGDDSRFHGLHVSPDVDTILYTLAGVVDRDRGWGIAGDTFHCLRALERVGEETWFQLGDRDLATHLRRTLRLGQGATLSEATEELRQSFGAGCRILPMTDGSAGTKLRTTAGLLSFQDYFVKLRQQPEVLEMDFSAAQASRAAPGVVESIQRADGVVLAPSNPLLSIGPILAVPGIREALRKTAAPVAAVTPIVAGRALKGPADRILASLGLGATATAVAELYRDFLDVFILDSQDAVLREQIQRLGMDVVVTQTVMESAEARQELARTVLGALGKGSTEGGATASSRSRL